MASYLFLVFIFFPHVSFLLLLYYILQWSNKFGIELLSTLKMPVEDLSSYDACNMIVITNKTYYIKHICNIYSFLVCMG